MILTGGGDLLIRLFELIVLAPWPLTLAIAGLLVGREYDLQRRRRVQNRALHELRRPLQTMLLAEPDHRAPRPGVGRYAGGRARAGALDLAIAALRDVDASINRSLLTPIAPGPERTGEVFEVGEILAAATERWRSAVLAAGRSISIGVARGGGRVAIDPVEAARALDNLIANALEHGGGDLELAVRGGPDTVRLEVTDGGRALAAAIDDAVRGPAIAATGGGMPAGVSERDRRDPRRGHGVAIVRQIAARAGGTFRLQERQQGFTAILELPAVPTGVA
ncbi:MAG TPA: ATP-binding protein [Solirubrobacterales bacterium]|nr:ATP-binding protein [Solirubrobacterales bacterium]